MSIMLVKVTSTCSSPRSSLTFAPLPVCARARLGPRAREHGNQAGQAGHHAAGGAGGDEGSVSEGEKPPVVPPPSRVKKLFRSIIMSFYEEEADSVAPDLAFGETVAVDTEALRDEIPKVSQNYMVGEDFSLYHGHAQWLIVSLFARNMAMFNGRLAVIFYNSLQKIQPLKSFYDGLKKIVLQFNSLYKTGKQEITSNATILNDLLRLQGTIFMF